MKNVQRIIRDVTAFQKDPTQTSGRSCVNNRVLICQSPIPESHEAILTDMLSPLELKLTQQIEQFLHQQNNRIQHLEDRVAQLEEERAALTTMLNLFDALKTPLSSS